MLRTVHVATACFSCSEFNKTNLFSLTPIRFIFQTVRFSFNQQLNFRGPYFKPLLSPFKRLHLQLNFDLRRTSGQSLETFQQNHAPSPHNIKCASLHPCSSLSSTLLLHHTSLSLFLLLAFQLFHATLFHENHLLCQQMIFME